VRRAWRLLQLPSSPVQLLLSSQPVHQPLSSAWRTRAQGLLLQLLESPAAAAIQLVFASACRVAADRATVALVVQSHRQPLLLLHVTPLQGSVD
jgi:hypothetical protein